MALLFVSLFGLITAALLSFGFAGSRTQVIVRDQRDQRYAADGAIEGAIQRYKETGTCGETPEAAEAYFTYRVHDKVATASCEADTVGGTPHPPQLIYPASADADSDFYPWNNNNQTDASLSEALARIDANEAPGKVARTDYVRPQWNSVKLRFPAPPQGGWDFAQVSALVSHKEGSGVGCCPQQDQRFSVTTSDGGGPIDCGTWNLNDMPAVGGPNWPRPPYEVVDLAYQQGHAGDASRRCLSSPIRVENAEITYSARHTNCGGRTIGGVSATGDIITSPNGNFSSRDVVSPQAAVTASGSPNFLASGTTLKAVLSPTQAQLNKTVTQAVTNRTITLGTPCGSVWDWLDAIALCACLSSRPTVATSDPVCNPATGGFNVDPSWQVNHGNQTAAQKDCTNGDASNPKDGIFQVGEPTLVGGNLNQCGANCPYASHMFFRDAEGGVSRTLILSGFTFNAPSTVLFVSLRVSHAEEASNIAVSAQVLWGDEVKCTLAIPTANTGTTATSRRYVADQVMLPDECAPTTAALMAQTTVRYTVTCTPIGTGVCATGNTNPRAYVDALVLDLNYELGGEGGTPTAKFLAYSGSNAVCARTEGEDVAVQTYRPAESC